MFHLNLNTLFVHISQQLHVCLCRLFLCLQVADIAVRYHSCDGNGDLALGARLVRQSPCCQSIPLPQSSGSVCEVCLSHSAASSSCVCFLSQGGAFQSHLRNCCLYQGSAASDGETSAACTNLKYSYSPFSQYSACCRRLAPPHLKGLQSKEELEVPPSRAAAPSVGRLQGADGVTGLRCQTNRTLRFYVLDVALNLPLAVRLGATRNSSMWQRRDDGMAQQQQQQQLEGSDGSFATIVDLQDEVHYVLHRSPAATLTQSLGESHYNDIH